MPYVRTSANEPFFRPSAAQFCYHVNMKLKLTDELQQALEQGQGIVQASSFVVLSIDVFREMMGVGTDEEMAASVAALKKSMEEARAGKTRPMTDALDDLGRKYEVPS